MAFGTLITILTIENLNSWNICGVITGIASGWFAPSRFMDNELTHLLMQSVLDIAMPIAQTQFIDCLKKLAQKLKDEGKF